MLPRPRGPSSPHASSCQELGLPWTPSPVGPRGAPLVTGVLAPGHLRGSAPSMRDPGLLCLWGWGVALAPARGSVQGKPHRKRAWPNGRPSRSRPWDTNVLSHFRRRPREAGRPAGPCLLPVGAPRPRGDRVGLEPDGRAGGQCLCVCVWEGSGDGAGPLAPPVSQWWAPPALGTGVPPVFGVFVSTIFSVSV